MSGSRILEMETIDPEALLSRVDSLKLDEWRLVQILCVAMDDGHELTYSFGGGLALWNLRMQVRTARPVPSITAIYPAAFLYENEIRDLFGVRIERIAPDWEGKVYGGTADKPFHKMVVTPTSSEGGSK